MNEIGDSYALFLPEGELPAVFKRASVAEVEAVLQRPLGGATDPIPVASIRYPISCGHLTCPHELGFVYDLHKCSWPLAHEMVTGIYGGVFIYQGVGHDFRKLRLQAVYDQTMVVGFQALSH